MQIAGNPCFVCSQTIGLMRDGAGCLRCQRVFHRSCLTEQVCPNCGESLLPTDTVHETRVHPTGPAGIGGWMILPAIGFVLGPIVSFVSLVRGVTLFSAVKAAGYGGIYALDLLLEAGLLAFGLYVVRRFFDKKRDAPPLIVRFFVVSLGATAAFLVVALLTGAEIFAVETQKQLAREAIGAAIWIPYFKKSKRVEATFVN